MCSVQKPVVDEDGVARCCVERDLLGLVLQQRVFRRLVIPAGGKPVMEGESPTMAPG
jgi:hypothetical protein